MLTNTSTSRHNNTLKRQLAYGDKIYARLIVNGNNAAEISMDTFSDFSQVIGEIRRIAYKYGGLALLYVRNMTRGWSVKQPLMLYNDIYRRVASRIPRDNAAVTAIRYA